MKKDCSYSVMERTGLKLDQQDLWDSLDRVFQCCDPDNPRIMRAMVQKILVSVLLRLIDETYKSCYGVRQIKNFSPRRLGGTESGLLAGHQENFDDRFLQMRTCLVLK